MAHSVKPLMMALIALFTAFTWKSVYAAEPPADLCSLLPAADVSRILGQTFAAPQKTEAPRPFANTNTGTDCNYLSKSGGKLWFRAYVDPSPTASADLFSKLSKYYGPPTPVKDLADEAYFDSQHAIHVRKGKVRFYLNLSPMPRPAPAGEQQIKALAGVVAAKL